MFSSLCLTIFIIIFGFYFISFIYKLCRINYYIRKIPGPPGKLFFANTFDFLMNLDDLWAIARQLNQEYYPTFKFSTPLLTNVNVSHPDDVEVILSSIKHITKSNLYDFLHDWFGTGLLTSTGSKWRQRRKILTPAFHFNVLKEFSEIFHQEGQRMVRDLKKNKEEVVDLRMFTARYTLNAICETAMGKSLVNTEEFGENFQKTYRQAVHDLGNIILYRAMRPWIYPNVVYYFTKFSKLQKEFIEIIRGFSKKIIGERQRYHEENGGLFLNAMEDNPDTEVDIKNVSKKKLAMLDLLILAMKNNCIDDEGIWEEVDTFIFEGHDTTAMGLLFTLLLLAEHKDIQERIRVDVDDMFRNSDGNIGIAELQQLQYLERCIKEALRLYPSVPFISRRITSDLQLKDYLIPAGVMMHIHIFDTHRNPEFWPDPLRFDPDRFLPGLIEKRHPFSYVPFSGGPRNCIGQKFALLELKAMISHLVHNFYLETVDLAHEITIISDIVIRPKGAARIKFVPRE